MAKATPFSYGVGRTTTIGKKMRISFGPSLVHGTATFANLFERDPFRRLSSQVPLEFDGTFETDSVARPKRV